MAFTDPRTWVTDELVTAAMMNAHIRDNFNSTWHLLARKTADESVTSSTTLQDDADLNLAVGVNEVWKLEWQLRVTGSAGDFKFVHTFPAAGELGITFVAHFSGVFSGEEVLNTTSPSGSNAADIGTIGSLLTIDGLYVGGVNAGNVVLQWAQSTSSATATIVKAQSSLWGCQLA